MTFFKQKDIFVNLQTLLILCFFNLPNFYSNNIDSDYRRDVLNLGDISLYENLLFNVIILLYIAVIIISQRIIKLNIPIKKIFYNQKIKYYYFYFFIILFIVFHFYLSKIGAILEEGYAAYHLNDLSVKSSFFIVILDLFLKFLLFKGIADNKKFANFFYFLYHILLILTGLRFPGFIGIIIWFLIKKHTYINNNKFKIIGLSLISPYILILTQRIRTFSDSNDIGFNIFETALKELIVQFNFTAETLRAVIRGPLDYEINLFYGFVQFILSIYNKVIGSTISIEQRADLGAFPYAQTRSLRPDLFEMGVTFGNSVFSETYAAMGLVGIVLIAIVHSYFFKLLFELRHKSNQIILIWITHYFIAIPLLKTVRSSSLDWMLNSLILSVFLYILSKLYISKSKSI